MSNENLRKLFRFDAIITVTSGALMLGVPDLLINVLQLGRVTPMWLRIVGAIWLVFGIWLLSIWNATYTKGMATAAAVILALNGDLLLLAPLFGNLELGILGWISMLGTAALIFFIAWQWWLLRKRL